LCNKKDNANRERLREKTQRPKGELSSVSTLVAALTFAIDPEVWAYQTNGGEFARHALLCLGDGQKARVRNEIQERHKLWKSMKECSARSEKLRMNSRAPRSSQSARKQSARQIAERLARFE
jgi:hypothetical protein